MGFCGVAVTQPTCHCSNEKLPVSCLDHPFCRREVDSVVLPYLNRARLSYAARAFLSTGAESPLAACLSVACAWVTACPAGAAPATASAHPCVTTHACAMAHISAQSSCRACLPHNAQQALPVHSLSPLDLCCPSTARRRGTRVGRRQRTGTSHAMERPPQWPGGAGRYR